jgi:para-aminobenzoate synthetase component I
MSPLKPNGLGNHADQPWERSRTEWWVGDGGDPASLVEDFLADQGLPVRDLAATGHRYGPAREATLFLSAAACARLAGAPTGPPSPAPAVPDLVVVVQEDRAAPPRPPAGPWRVGRWRASWSPARHAAAVAEVREAIARGDVYQVNLVGHARARYRGDPLPALRRVAALPGARYGRILRGRGWAIGCASPETLAEVAGGRVITRPIKGTRPATAAGREQLLDSVKERAEHVMIVDLERNDLARLARTGTVRVEELYAVRRWCDLWQAESVVSAELAGGVGLAGLLRALCPGGSVTGAPKLAALDVIAGLEPVGRGPSMGLLGRVGPDRIDLGLTIRTVAADAEHLHVWAGGGITWGSDPAAEVAEAAAKAGPLRTALGGPTGCR